MIARFLSDIFTSSLSIEPDPGARASQSAGVEALEEEVVVDSIPLLSVSDNAAKFDGVAGPQVVPLKAFTPYVWMALEERRDERTSGPSSLRPFPVVIDTGFSKSLTLHGWHFQEWVGLNVAALTPPSKPLFIHDQPHPVVKVDAWIYKYKFSVLEPPAPDSPKHKVRLNPGCTVSSLYVQKAYTKSDQSNDAVKELYRQNERRKKIGTVEPGIHPRIPTLGVGLLAANNLRFSFVPSSEVCTLAVRQ